MSPGSGMHDDPTRRIVLTILKRCAAILDVKQRSMVLREILSSLDYSDAVKVLSGLETARNRLEPGSREAVQALAKALELDCLEYEWISGVYREAKDKGNDWITALLSPARARKEPASHELRPNRLLSALPLGTRRQLARKPDRNLLDRLAVDPDPGVVERILSNPRVTEQDVVRIVARRPANPEVLRVVFGHPKWGANVRVKSALVRNPYTPTDVALRLLPQMMLQDIKAVARDASLHESVINEARRLLASRASGAGTSGEGKDEAGH